jgi:hypothetical protein
MVGLDACQGKDQAMMNDFITSFGPLRFQRLLMRWVACDNVLFNTLERPSRGYEIPEQRHYLVRKSPNP